MRLTKKEYTSEEEKKKDFRLGLIGWYVGNFALCLIQAGVSALLVSLVSSTSSGDSAVGLIGNALTWILYLLPWIINIGLIIFFALTRSQIALGMLVGFASAVALVIILGIIFTIACFVMYSGSGSS
jgi:hypothetical protein